MNSLINVVANDSLTMSSLEIAKLTKVRHDNARRTMESLKNKGLITVTQFEEPTKGGGKPTLVYHVNKRDSFVVVARLSPEFTAALVDRWQKLEAEVSEPKYQLPDFTNPVEAARAWANEVEAKQALEHKVEEDKPKVKFFEDIGDANNLQNMTAVSQALGIGRNTLFKQLRDMGIFQKDKTYPYTRFINEGYFVVKEKVAPNGNFFSQTFVTGKGLQYLYNKLILN